MIKPTILMVVAGMLLLAGGFPCSILAQGDGAALPVASEDAPSTAKLNFNEAPLDILLMDYSEKTGKTLLRAPGLPTATVTLRSQGDLKIEDYLKAIEASLTMHGVGLVEYGDTFVRVVPIKAVLREGIGVRESMTDGQMVPELSGAMVSQMVSLKSIDIAEALKAIEPIRSENGQLNQFDRINALLITDMPENINRMLQVLRLIDQPVEAREEPNIIQIRFAKAADIKSKLEEIIAESQKEQQASTVPRSNPSGAPGAVSAPSSPPGVIRPGRVVVHQTATQEPAAALIEAAERGIIRGKVQIVADQRTNKLIIITRPENMAFFERIIDVLDVETSPDVTVKVMRLEFATAEEVATMLNDLIGATKKEEGAPVRTGEEGTDSKRLAEVAAAAAAARAASQQQQPSDRKSSVGELSKDNIKILSDKRTNSLILMASKSDLVTLEEIIKDMDMMLSQVLIEAVIIEVQLGDSIATGVSWIQKSMTAYSRDAAGGRSPIYSFAGGGGGAMDRTPLDAARLNDSEQLASSGLGYFFTLYDLNLNALVKASASDSRTRVVSTPALLTTDNTEAKLTSTDRIYVFEGTTYSGTTTDSRTARYRQEDVGLSLTVKPQINENQVVMMEIKQEVSEPGQTTGLDTEKLSGVVISRNRTLQASVAVTSGQTIVLGGQVRDSNSRSRTKIPLLGDIPFLGRLFNSDSRDVGRTETIVFITPYVLDSPDEVNRETRRRRDSLSIDGMWKKGWSGSQLAEEPAVDKSKPRVSPTNAPAVTPAPEARAVPRLSPWTTSDGKVAKGGDRATGDTAQRPVPHQEPAAAGSSSPAGSSEPINNDAFIREQMQKWESAVKSETP